MNRISALNGDSDSGSSDDDETHVTQEAQVSFVILIATWTFYQTHITHMILRPSQETIAFSEYMRALQLKAAGNLQMAESLLGELLETKVLNEVKYLCLYIK